MTSTVFGTTIHVVNNTAPIAENDGYSIFQGATLSVDAATGVPANDADPDGGGLNAALLNDVANGSLTLNTDGSFSYTHDPGFAGVDTFSYRASDGISSSNAATVTITVLANLDIPFTVQLQGRPPPPDASWELGFTLDFYTPGAGPLIDGPIHSQAVATNQSGTLQATVAPGSYDIRAKGENTLRVLMPDVDLTASPTTTINLGTQIAGDSNGDNVVDAGDYNDVRDAFGSVVADLAFNLQGTDHNNGGIVDTTDYSMVVANFNTPGAPP